MKSFGFVIFDKTNAADEWMSIGYLSSWLNRLDEIKVQIGFYSFNDIEKAVETTINEGYFAIGLPVITRNFYYVLEFVQQYKRRGGKGKVILGNLASNDYASFIFNRYEEVDIISFGESEHTLYEVCMRLLNSQNLDGCDGIWFRGENGDLIKNNQRKLEEDLDAFKFPDRTYYKKTTIFSILGARGCMANCTFCDSNSSFKYNHGSRVRLRSVKDILDEIETLVNEDRYAYIIFQDQTFCNESDNFDRLDELREGLAERDLKIQFSIMARTEQITDLYIQKMIELFKYGLSELFVGFEAGNAGDLKLFGKIAQIDAVNNAARLLNKYKIITNESGILFRYGLINFHPYSTFESLRENAEFIKKYNLPITLSWLSNKLVISGTCAITKKIKKDGLCTQDINMPLTDEYGYRYLDPRMNKVYEYMIYAVKFLAVTSGKAINIFAKLKTLYGDYSKRDDFKAVQNIMRDASQATLEIYNTILDIVQYEMDDQLLKDLLIKYKDAFHAGSSKIETINIRLSKDLYKKNMLAIWGDTSEENYVDAFLRDNLIAGKSN